MSLLPFITPQKRHDYTFLYTIVTIFWLLISNTWVNAHALSFHAQDSIQSKNSDPNYIYLESPSWHAFENNKQTMIPVVRSNPTTETITVTYTITPKTASASHTYSSYSDQIVFHNQNTYTQIPIPLNDNILASPIKTIDVSLQHAEGNASLLTTSTTRITIFDDDIAWKWENPLPGGRKLNSIWGISPSRRFAVGNHGLILMDSGQGWEQIRSHTIEDLYHVWGFDETHVYAVGNHGIILMFNGYQWIAMSSDFSFPLFHIIGYAPTDLYACGKNGIIHFNGLSWEPVAPSYLSYLSLNAMWLDQNRLIAVGGTVDDDQFENGVIITLEGNTLISKNNFPEYGFTDIWGTDSHMIYVVGGTQDKSGVILSHNGLWWSTTPTIMPTKPLWGIWGNDANHITAVGGHPDHGGAIFQYNGSTWINQSVQIPVPLRDISGISEIQKCAVGDDGISWVREGITWTMEQQNIRSILNDVWMSNQSLAVAVGQEGALLVYNGIKWEQQPIDPMICLNGVWGSSSNHIYAVGNAGAIMMYNGYDWISQYTGYTSDLYAIWGTSDTHMVIVGAYGTILNYESGTWLSVNLNINDHLYDIWADSPQHAFAVGQNGLVLESAAGLWQVIKPSDSSEPDWLSIWGVSSTEIFIGGKKGKISLYNGTDFFVLKEAQDNQPDITDIWGTQSDQMWAVDAVGNILFFDGRTWSIVHEAISPGLTAITGSQSRMHMLAVGMIGTIMRYAPFVNLSAPDVVFESDGYHLGSIHYDVENPPLSDLPVKLDSSDPLSLTVTQFIVMPNDQSLTSFTLAPQDNLTINGPQYVQIHAIIPEFHTASKWIQVLDNESIPLSITCQPVMIEGDLLYDYAFIDIPYSLTKPLTIDLKADPPHAMAVPGKLEIEPGQTSQSFSLYAVDNTLFDDTQDIIITATVAGWSDVISHTITVEDNDPKALSLIMPDHVMENDEDGIHFGSVMIPGILTSDLSITLSVQNSNKIECPSSVVVPAGQPFVSFPIHVNDNAMLDQTIEVTVEASAQGWQPVSINLFVIDNEPGQTRFESDILFVSENDMYASIKVIRTQSSYDILTVFYETTDGNAIAGDHYLPSSGHVVFENGVMEKTIQIPIIQTQGIDEPKTFFVNLIDSENKGWVILPDHVQVTIQEGAFDFDWQHPKPQGNALHQVFALSDDRAIAVGNHGTILNYENHLWQKMTSGTNEMLYAVWGKSETECYAAGQNGLILFYNGDVWKKLPLIPVDIHLYGLWGIDNDLYVVGEHLTILKFDGYEWTIMHQGTDVDPPLYSIWGDSYNQLYAVGGFDQNGILFQFNGYDWMPIELDNHPVPSLKHIWGDSLGTIYAVGDQASIFQYNNGQWVKQSQNVAPDTQLMFHSIGCNASQDWIIAGGDILEGGILLEKRNNTWKRIEIETPAFLNSISGVSQRFFAVGDFGQIIYYDHTWQTYSPGPDQMINDIWGKSADSLVAVGNHGHIFHYNGQTWQQLLGGSHPDLIGLSGVDNTQFAVGSAGLIIRIQDYEIKDIINVSSSTLNSVWVAYEDQAIAVGEEGVILSYAQGQWRPMSHAFDTTGLNLTDIWGSDINHVYAVGDNSTILFYDGSTWSLVPNNPFAVQGVKFNSIWGRAIDDIYVVGDSGAALHFDGYQWLRLDLDPEIYLKDIWGDENQVFAACTDGRLFNYNGSKWTPLETGSDIYLDCIWTDGQVIITAGEQGTIIRGLSTQATSDLFMTYQLGSTDLYPGQTMVSTIQINNTGNDAAIDTQLTAEASDPFLSFAYSLNQGITWETLNINDPILIGYIPSQSIQTIIIQTLIPMTYHSDHVSYSLTVVSKTQDTSFYNNHKVIIADVYEIPTQVWQFQNQLSPVTSNLNGVWGRSEQDIYVVGKYGTILHFTDQWREEQSPVSEDLNSVWGTYNQVFAVGNTGTILQNNGSDWIKQLVPTTTHLRTVWGRSDQEIYASGDEGIMLQWDGSEWQLMLNHPDVTIHAIWGIQNQVFAIGENQTIYLLSNNQWNEVHRSIPGVFNSGAGDDMNMFVVGKGLYDKGIVMQFMQSKWVKQLAVSNTLNSIWTFQPGSAMTVGDQGTIVFFDGAGWQGMDSGTVNHLKSVWGTQKQLIAVGDNGTILSCEPLYFIIPESFSENDGPVEAWIGRYQPTNNDLHVSLVSDAPEQLSLPDSIVIPAGASQAQFELIPIDDIGADGLQFVRLTASAPGVMTGTVITRVYDNETAVLSLHIPEEATEGDGMLVNQAMISAGLLVSAPVNVLLKSSNPKEVITPEFVTIPKGQGFIHFDLTIVDDTAIDGLQSVTITASVPSWQDGVAVIKIHDNDFNLPPVISNIPDLTINEDTQLVTSSFTLDDDRTEAYLLQVTISSTNSYLFPLSNLRVEGTSAIRHIRGMPVLNASGQSRITLVVSDTEGLTAWTSFEVTVTSVNDPPIFEGVSDITLTEDTISLPIPITVTDIDGQIVSLKAESLNPTLIPNAGLELLHQGMTHILTCIPNLNQYGETTILLTAIDDMNLAYTKTFKLTVIAGNDPPTISQISNQQFDEDTLLHNIYFDIQDSDGGLLTVKWETPHSNIYPLKRIQLNHKWPNYYTQLTLPSQSIPITLTVEPLSNANGPINMTVTVMDTDDASQSSTFTILVNSVNDPPVISQIEDKIGHPGIPISNIPFSVMDIDTPLDQLVIQAKSSNPKLIHPDHISMSGNTASRFLSLTPTIGQIGESAITVTVSDGEDYSWAVFQLSVPNEHPTISNIQNKSTHEDQSIEIAFEINDDETPLTTLQLSVISSNETLIPSSTLMILGQTSHRTMQIVPAMNQSGTSTITITVQDQHGASAMDSFQIIVNPVNDMPVLSLIEQQIILEDQSSDLISFTIMDNETSPENLLLTVYVSNPELIPSQGIQLGGMDSQRSLFLTPTANAYGGATVTVQVTDEAYDMAEQSFYFQVMPVNDPPHFSLSTTHINVQEDDGRKTYQNFITNIQTGPLNESSQTVMFMVNSSQNDLFLTPPVISQSGTLTFTPKPFHWGIASIQVYIKDDGGTNYGGIDKSGIQSFTIDIHPGLRGLTLSVPDRVLETAGVLTQSGILTVTDPPDQARQILLQSDHPLDIVIPERVVIPSGVSMVPFSLTIVDDDIIETNQTIQFTASAPGYLTAIAHMTIEDNDPTIPPQISLTVPSTVNETSGVIINGGHVSVSRPSSQSIQIILSNSDASELTVPSEVTIPAGYTYVNFNIWVLDDTDIDGSITAVISAEKSGYMSDSKDILVIDNDKPIIYYILTTTVSPIGYGMVSTQSMDCSSLCEQEFQAGHQVIVNVITQGKEYAFLTWKSNHASYNNRTDPVLYIDMSADIRLTAVFIENHPPDSPQTLYPTNHAIVSETNVTFQTSPFDDYDDHSHTKTYWRIRRSDKPYCCSSANSYCYTSTVYDTSLTQYTSTSLLSGFEYAWQVAYEDENGYVSSWSKESFFVIGSLFVDRSIVIPEGEEAADYRMVSFSQWPKDPSIISILQDDIQGGYDSTRYKIGTYDPVKGWYVEYNEDFMIFPGRACWFLSLISFPLTIEGVPLNRNEPVDVPLIYNNDTQDGWNMIGCPNQFDYEWHKIEIIAYNSTGQEVYSETIGSIISQISMDATYRSPNISPYLWQWQDGNYSWDTTILKANQGYWVEARSSSVYLRFLPTARFTGRRAQSDHFFGLTAPTYEPPGPMNGYSTRTEGNDIHSGCFIQVSGE